MENKKKTRNYIIVLSLCVLCLIVIVFSVAYAYFAPRVEGVGKDWNLGAGIARLKISGDKIEVTNALPIYEEDKDRKAFKQEIAITLSDDSTLDSCFQIDLDINNIGSNLRNKYFKYEFYREGEDIPIKSGSFGDESIIYEEKTINVGTEDTPILKNVTTASIVLLTNEYISIIENNNVEDNIEEEDSLEETIDPNEDIEVETPLEETEGKNPDETQNESNEETPKTEKEVKKYILKIWLTYDRVEDQTSILTGAPETREFSATIHAHGVTGKCKIDENLEKKEPTE